MITLAYQVVDVFTGTAFTGNPLAVVLDTDGLSTAQLQALANEFNLSETAFPQRSEVADYRLRIFTPATELPFAGHPSVGAAWVMAQLGRVARGPVTMECGAGVLPLQVGDDDVTLTGGDPTLSGPLDAAPLLAAVGLDAADLAGEPRLAGTGLEWVCLPVRDDAVARSRPADLSAVPGAGVSVYALDGREAHARVFAGGVGVAEDPATGSAALALGVHLAGSGLLTGAYVVRQGFEMGRPSVLHGTRRRRRPGHRARAGRPGRPRRGRRDRRTRVRRHRHRRAGRDQPQHPALAGPPLRLVLAVGRVQPLGVQHAHGLVPRGRARGDLLHVRDPLHQPVALARPAAHGHDHLRAVGERLLQPAGHHQGRALVPHVPDRLLAAPAPHPDEPGPPGRLLDGAALHGASLPGAAAASMDA